MEESTSRFSFLHRALVNSPSILKLIYLLVIMVFAVIILGFIGDLLAALLFSMSFKELSHELSGGFQSGNINLLRYFLSIQNVSMFLVPALLAHYLFLKRDQAFLHGNHRINYLVPLLLLLGIIVVSTPFVNWLSFINQKMVLPDSMKAVEEKMMSMESERSDLTLRLMGPKTPGILMLNLLLIAVIPAISEEFFFRGTLQNIFKQWTGNTHAAIIITAFIFSAIHMQFYGFLPRFYLGLLFGYIFFQTRNIWLAVFAHFLNNAMMVVIAYLMSDKVDKVGEIGNTDMKLLTIPVMMSLSGIVLFMILLVRNTQKQERLN